MPLGTDVGRGAGDIVLDGDPAIPLSKKGTAAPHFSAHVYCGQTVAHTSNCNSYIVKIINGINNEN